MHSKSPQLVLLIVLIISLAACGTNATPAPTQSNEIPVGTPMELGIAPDFKLPAEPITTENANQLALLGRLDLPPGSASSIFSFDFSPDGTRLAAVNNDLLMGWDLSRGVLLFSSSRLGIVRVYYSPDKTELYAVTDIGGVAIYDEAGNQKTGFTGVDAFNGSVDYNDVDVGLLALGSDSGEVRVWDTAERASLVTIKAHESGIERLAFSPDASQLVTVGYNDRAILWDWRERKPLFDLPLRDQSSTQIAFSPDQSRLAIATTTYILVFDTQTGVVLQSLFIPEGASDAFLRYTPDGRYLVSAGGESGMMFWDAITGLQVGQVPEMTGGRISAVFNPVGDLMVTSVFEMQSALWNLQTVSAEGLQRVALNPGTRSIINLGWTDDGYLIAFFDAKGTVYLWGIAE
jgi:WD40 repeat protein